MLQQTQVDRVKDKYEEFIAAFPDFQSLRRASLSQVCGVWLGLGYNRRALSLKKMAETVVLVYKGQLPDTKEELMALPGIGKATAASILAFGFNKPEVFIETNVRSVFIHCFFPNSVTVTDAEIAPLVEKMLDRSNPRKWYSAIMDYGTMLKKQRPNPSRKSAHYAAQSPFQGSKRQLRGAVLKLLLQTPHLTVMEIAARIGKSEAFRVNAVVSDLKKDGLVKVRKGLYSIG